MIPRNESEPFPLIVNDELEHAVPVWRTEGGGILAQGPRYREECSSDVRV
jgi:hypothetical protein